MNSIENKKIILDVVVIDDGANKWVAKKTDVLDHFRTTFVPLHRAMGAVEYDRFCQDTPCLVDQSNSYNVTGRDPYEVIEELLDEGADVLHIE